MRILSRPHIGLKPSLLGILLYGFLLILWIAGGASRSDVTAQVVVRVTATFVLIVAIVFGDRSDFGHARPVYMLLGAAITIAILQLVPLPPGMWQALPGRTVFTGVFGESEVWRAWSLVPGATINALFSLIVPLAMLVLVTGLSINERAWLPAALLWFILASMVVGVLQFSGAGIENPLINDSSGVVSGTFANRNHFALFLALGCLLVPVWMFREGLRLQWRGPVGVALILLFTLTILASGSRAGMAVGALAIVTAGIIARGRLRQGLRRTPRWLLPAVATLLVALVLVSVAANRAISIQRSLSADVEQDMRSRSFSTVWDMTRRTFPAGSGLGGFDPMFRANEPFALLKPTYFNQAHNDFIEVVFGAGLPGLLLLIAAVAWWAWASVRAWRNRANRQSMLPQLGSAMILLVLVASVFDYPARTPLIMAMMVIAAMWLSGQSDEDVVSALPGSGQHL